MSTAGAPFAWRLNAALLLLAMGWIFSLGTPLERVEREWFDYWLRWRAERGFAPPVDARIVCIDLTDEDLAECASLHQEYQLYADIVRAATTLDAQLLALDVVMARGTPADGRPVIEAVQDSGRVLLSQDLFSPRSGRSFPYLPDTPAPQGAIDVQADPDGTFREYTMALPPPADIRGLTKPQRAQAALPSLALVAYLTLQGVRWPDDVKIEPQRIAWDELSADGTSRASRSVTREPLLLDFRAPWSMSPSESRAAFRHVPVAELLRLARQGSHDLAGAILFLAYCGADMDRGRTPIGADQPRVSLHITALDDLLQGTFHRRAPRWADALCCLVVLALGWAARRRGVLMLTAVWGLGAALIAACGVAALYRTPWVPATATTLIVWTVAYGVELLRRSQAELLARTRLDAILEYYFSPRVAAQIKQNPQGLTGAREAELVLLLTDIRNFTVLSEQLGAERVFALLNRIFEVMTHAVMDEDGCLEHFLGDQFLSYWGAPEPQPDAADRALRAAVRILTDMAALRATLEPDIVELFGFGLALHAGTALVGNKGSKRRLDYGILGDTVNSAARVEALTKAYRVPFLVTREVLARLSQAPPHRLVDRILPVGKRVPMELFEIRTGQDPPAFEALATAYTAAFERYAAGDFGSALTAFEALADRHDDGPSLLLAARCHAFIDDPPDDWRGVYQFKHK